MRILLVSTYFEPDQGSTAITLSRLARQLQERGHELTVLTTLPNYPQGRIHDGYRGRPVVVEQRDGIRVIQTWLWATPSPRISRKLVSQVSFMLTAGLRGLAILHPDVVFIEAQPVFTSLAGVFLSRVKRVPYVLDVSDLWPDHLLSVGALTELHPAYRVARRVVDATYRGAARIIALHDGLARGLAGHLGSTEKIRTIYSGADLERFRPGQDSDAFRRKYELGAARLVTFIGTFATPYDFDLLLTVARRLNDRSDVRVVFIGSGSQSDRVRQRLAEDGSLSNLRWIGWMDHAEMPAAWSASHLTFWALRDHPLYRGTFPAKSLEAMASGVPIAAAMEGIGAEILERSGGGIAVPFGDADGLSQAVRRLLDDEAFHRQCSQSARVFAEAHFDSRQTTLAYEAALREAAHL